MTRSWILGEKFSQRYPHLDGIDALWHKKWQFPCTRSLYPFHDGAYEDFEPIFRTLIEKNINDGYTDEYTKEFIPTAERLVKEGDDAKESGDKARAVELYKRACTVYRIARFPYICSDLKTKIYDTQNEIYLKAASLWDVQLYEEVIPHTTAKGDDKRKIPLFVRLPTGATKERPCPAILLMTGLDGHRPDNTTRSDEFLARGWASVIADIPGTADCPADRKDPASPDRLWTAVLDWMQEQGVFDMKKIVVWGLSMGGYYAIRAAHTHAKRLAGSVAQGAGHHLFFEREWLEQADNHEYPFAALPAMSMKFGYKDPEEFMNNAQKDFSLVTNGIVDMDSTRLLLINGTHDGLMPIEDSMLLMEYGKPKEARFFTGLLHMGYPPANGSVYPWMEQVMATAS
ncbi:hypothetical protein LTR66_002096 [Elasticomyces elasticus]|nr:hypothetical protein LTR50_005273 [Elasticomyces elasticus]KAK4998729.1 hypothetical protein LTR66_002096 [Elasticomyces elasticus]